MTGSSAATARPPVDVAESWAPLLDDGSGALYARIVGALERDMKSGLLPAGLRLPPQRSLATRLGLSVGTVTKAYLEAERRGLVRGHVGRGTFILAPPGAPAPVAGERDQVIDLALNIIPHQGASRRFAEGLSELKRRPDLVDGLFDALAYAPPAGPEDQRRAACAWLKEIAGLDADWTRLVMTTGAQQAMSLAFGQLCRPGDGVLCEAATFYGMKTLADHGGYRLHGVRMDEQGMIPDDLDRTAATSHAKVVYIMPSVQNPTGRTMGDRRRADIAEVIERRGLWVVEDDNYAAFAPRGRDRSRTLTERLPERSFYVGGVSKSLAPGLRVGFLLCPSGPHHETALRAVRATTYAPPTLGGLFFSQWVEDGSAYEIAASVREEIEQRGALAREVLGEALTEGMGAGPHLWLPMPELQGERVAGRAFRAGVAVTPPGAPIVRDEAISGLRICLGAPVSRAELQVGLQRLRAALHPQIDRAEAAVV